MSFINIVSRKKIVFIFCFSIACILVFLISIKILARDIGSEDSDKGSVYQEVYESIISPSGVVTNVYSSEDPFQLNQVRNQFLGELYRKIDEAKQLEQLEKNFRDIEKENLEVDQANKKLFDINQIEVAKKKMNKKLIEIEKKYVEEKNVADLEMKSVENGPILPPSK